jgi:hypothetical protein
MVPNTSSLLKRDYAYNTFVLLLSIIQILAVLCSLAQPAYAYVDPGSGLFTLQIISTTFAGIIFFIRRKFRCLFGTRHAGPKSEKVIKK